MPIQFFREVRETGWRGWPRALSGLYKRRHLPLYGYLALTIGVIIALNSIRDEGIHRRREVATATQHVAVLSCKHQNVTRQQLRLIIHNGIPPIRGYVKRGLLTKQEGQIAIAQSRRAIRILRDSPCSRIKIDQAGG